MKYTYLELNGFKRFSLNQIETFNITFTDPVQVILGTNGSGKTSCISQITPLPPNHSDFSKTGSKIIHIEDDKNLYVLKSVFSPSVKHSFIRNDIELNDGGTSTVQKELVKTHFRITPEIHSLILGEELFTNMPANRRKEVFILLCDTNYDFAIKVYNKLKEKHRDTVGALKIAKKRLILETEKQLKTNEELLLKEQTNEVHQLLNHLLEYRKPIETDETSLRIQQSNLDEQLNKTTKQLKSIYTNKDKNYSEDELNSKIKHVEIQLAKNQALMQNYSNELSKVEKKVSVLQSVTDTNLANLQKELSVTENEILILEQKLLFVNDKFDVLVAINAFDSVKSIISNIYCTIPINSDKKYSNENLTIARNNLAETIQYKSSQIDKLIRLQAKQKHMLLHKDKPDISCPKCSHSFSLEYNESNYSALLVNIDEIQNEIELNLNKKISDLNEYINSCIEYSNLYRQYNQCVSSYPILKPYWDYLFDKNIIIDNPLSGVSQLSFIDRDLSLQLEYKKLYDEFTIKTKTITSLKAVGDVDLNSLLVTQTELQNSIQSLTDASMGQIKRKNLYSQMLLQTKEIKSLIEKIDVMISNKNNLYKEEVENARRMILNDLIRKLQSDLAKKEHILHDANLLAAVLQNIENQIAELETEELALSALVDTMSPTDGLIAEGLFGFIKSFIDQMNVPIKKVWNYPLEIQSFSIDENESIDLNYKFPILSDNQQPIPDVKFGSTGIVEIVNLAFRISILQFLDLRNGAFYLDEPGNSFDAVHKTNLMNLIKTLIEQQLFNQLFIISHAYEQYSALSNSEVCVLDNRNIVTMDKYNLHVNINK